MVISLWIRMGLALQLELNMLISSLETLGSWRALCSHRSVKTCKDETQHLQIGLNSLFVLGFFFPILAKYRPLALVMLGLVFSRAESCVALSTRFAARSCNVHKGGGGLVRVRLRTSCGFVSLAVFWLKLGLVWGWERTLASELNPLLNLVYLVSIKTGNGLWWVLR